MKKYESSKKLNEITITKIFKEYQIKLISFLDSIHIIIQNKSYDLYESYFKSNYLNQLFMTNKTINGLIQFISILIEENKIKIQINKKNLKLILTTINVELLLKKNKTM